MRLYPLNPLNRHMTTFVRPNRAVRDLCPKSLLRLLSNPDNLSISPDLPHLSQNNMPRCPLSSQPLPDRNLLELRVGMYRPLHPLVCSSSRRLRLGS